MNPEKSLPRRSILLGAGAVGGGALALSACAASPTGATASQTAAGPSVPAGTAVRVGKLSEVKVGSTATGNVNGKTVVIFRQDDKTVLAYDAACTHAGCPVAPAGEDFDCPCHGSRFTMDGAILDGPAVHELGTIEVSTIKKLLTERF